MKNKLHPNWGGKRPGQGRPKSEDKRLIIPIRFSSAERNELENAADQTGKTFSAFVREAALNQAKALNQKQTKNQN